MQLNLSRLHFPVTTLGLGRRAAVWFQGCSLRCPGCVSVDTWATGRAATTVDAVMEAMEPWLAKADGVTISGGEPFEQVRALEELLQHLRAKAQLTSDILVYSGYPWEQIAHQVAQWSGLIDVLISDPFVRGAGQTLVWRGSDNQRMHLLTPLGQSRYAEWIKAPKAALPKVLDLFFHEGEVWMAGIPSEGSLEAIQSHLADAGFSAATSQGDCADRNGVLPIFT